MSALLRIDQATTDRSARPAQVARLGGEVTQAGGPAEGRADAPATPGAR